MSLMDNKAYREGWNAGYAEPPTGPNPYPKGSDNHDKWSLGYGHGWEDAIEAWGL